MGEFVKSIIDKLSTYQFFNFIYPGAVFLGLLKFKEVQLPMLENVWWFLLASYFLGMMISRFGSIVIEWISEKAKWITKYDIKAYAKHLKADSFTGVLLELANIYRTLCSMGIILMICTIVGYNGADKCCMILLEVVFVALFWMSFIKQYHYLLNKLKD